MHPRGMKRRCTKIVVRQLDSSLVPAAMLSMRLLLIEDDAETANFIAQGLRALGHEIVVAVDGHDGLSRAIGETWHVVIVDRMLPGLDGLSLVRMLRAGGLLVPVLFLTTLDGIGDRVEGLNAGGDDYLVKPFALPELAARVTALGRRRSYPATAATTLQVGDLEIDLLARSVRREGRSIGLRPREYLLLEFLARNAGQVVTRTMLLEHVWNLHFDPNTNIVESHISRIRDKLGRDGTGLIRTIRGTGYIMPIAADD